MEQLERTNEDYKRHVEELKESSKSTKELVVNAEYVHSFIAALFMRSVVSASSTAVIFRALMLPVDRS